MKIFSDDKTKDKKRAKQYRELIRKASVLGGTVFGDVPKGVRREFFCLDETTWVWHEEWVDASGQKHIQTTRYDVRPDSIVKCQNNGHYQKVSPSEAKNLLEAARKYQYLVNSKLISA